MGQYHYVVNADKRQFLMPHRLGDGLKLMEFGMSGEGGVMTALAVLLAVSNGRGGGDLNSDSEIVGSWGGDRIAIVGDYAENTDLPTSFDPQPESIYGRCVNTQYPIDYDEHPDWQGLPTYRDISDDVAKLLTEAEGVQYSGGGWRERTWR